MKAKYICPAYRVHELEPRKMVAASYDAQSDDDDEMVDDLVINPVGGKTVDLYDPSNIW